MFYENEVAKALVLKDFQILARNYYASKAGEIDIVCKKNNDLFFFEVKKRSNPQTDQLFGITKYKLFKLKKSVRHFLHSYCYTFNQIFIYSALVTKGTVRFERIDV